MKLPRYIRLEMFDEHGTRNSNARIYLPTELGQASAPYAIIAADVARMCEECIEELKKT